MARTKEQIDNINIARQENGLAALPYDQEAQPNPGANDGAGNPATPAAPAASADGTPVVDPLKPAVPAPAPVAIPSDNSDPEEETEEQLIQKLQKRGFNVKSLEDLKPKETPEDIENKRKERASKKLSYGLEKGIITSDQYDAFRKDYNDPLGLVYEDFSQDQLAEDPSLSAEDIRERFQEIYHQDEDQNSYKFKRGKKAIETLAERIVREKHDKVLSLDSAFDAYETEVQETSATQKKITEATPVYKNNVKAAIEAAKKIVVPVSETESYEVDALAEHLSEVEKNLLSDKAIRKNILDGTSAETLVRAVRMSVLEKGFKDYAVSFAEKYHLARAAGTKGIPPLSRQAPADGRAQKIYTEDQKKALAEMGMEHLAEPKVN